MTTNIYVLRLEGGRYYIGKSDDVVRRYQQHVRGYGSAWTKIYRPLSLEKVKEDTSPFEEDRITKEYMSKYGVDNVRGGSYVEVELSENQKNALNTEIWSANYCCAKCGRKGHFVKDCYSGKPVLGKRIEPYEFGSESGEEEDGWAGSSLGKKTQFRPSKPGNACYRCGRAGHYSPDCYASKHINGYYL